MDVKLKPIKVDEVTFTIVGISSLVPHRFPEKARKQIRDKKLGKKTKVREICDPQAEYEACFHKTESGEYGIPAGAFRQCLINAAHKDDGIEKTLVRKSLFIKSEDAGQIIPIRAEEPVMREDAVPIGKGTDLRYRPEFKAGWECDITVSYNSNNLTPEDVINLANYAGFSVGLLERRPEKGGEWGRFKVKTA